jgi:hypothetical protein
VRVFRSLKVRSTLLGLVDDGYPRAKNQLCAFRGGMDANPARLFHGAIRGLS